MPDPSHNPPEGAEAESPDSIYVEWAHRRLTVEELGEALRDERPNVRHAAAAALARMGSDPALEVLTIALRDELSWIRKVAAVGLGRLGARGIEPLSEALGDPSPGVRAAAVKMLIRMGQPAVRALCGALDAEDDRVRGAAAKALGQLRDPRAVEPLCRVLNDPSPDVRGAAVAALGRIGRREAVTALRARLLPLLGERNLTIVTSIRGALRSIQESQVTGLPLPSSPPSPDAHTLPRPALDPPDSA